MDVKAEAGLIETEEPVIEQPLNLEFVTSIQINPQSVNIGGSEMNRKLARQIKKNIAPVVK